ncbi:MAG TPA: hypothetical protein P5210_00120 [Draconibacterium sp.]|nr:hypothetical protein [Draconibacterium sp.]HRX10017.1 hypothetical protein [Draconibacterium sp.]
METMTACPTSTVTILACEKIVKTFKENIYELSRIRNDWDPGYATSLNVWVNDTIEKYYLGNKESIDYTRFVEWHDIMIAGMQGLKVLRASVKVDFKRDKPFLKSFFEKLGYTEFFSDAKNGDHLSLHKFLTTFAKNLDEETRKKVISKNTPDTVIEKILNCAQQITKFTECFEALEGDANLNSYGQKEVKEIYDTIQDISRIAMAYYQFDPVKRDLFNFYKVLVNL